MGQWKYRKPEASTIRGVCVLCGNNPQKSKGNGKYKPLCSPCDDRVFSPVSRKTQRKKRVKKYQRPYLKVYEKEARCARCGFEAEHSCQLDVDHIDGRKSNNSPDNLQTLCANCHRLKTFQNKDWEDR